MSIILWRRSERLGRASLSEIDTLSVVHTVPVTLLWIFASHILHLFMLPEVADKAGLYLQDLGLGVPAYAIFECGKRFMLAQGLFSATLWVLCLCAPLNTFLNYFFVCVCVHDVFFLLLGADIICTELEIGVHWGPGRCCDCPESDASDSDTLH